QSRWAVVLSRPMVSPGELQPDFSTRTPVDTTFAVWNGSRGHRDGIKSVSAFVQLRLTDQPPPGEAARAAGRRVLFVPVAALILSAGLASLALRDRGPQQTQRCSAPVPLGRVDSASGGDGADRFPYQHSHIHPYPRSRRSRGSSLGRVGAGSFGLLSDAGPTARLVGSLDHLPGTRLPVPQRAADRRPGTRAGGFGFGHRGTRFSPLRRVDGSRGCRSGRGGGAQRR